MKKEKSYKGLNTTLIHQLKRNIEELNKEKEKYSALFEQSNDAIVLITTKGIIFGLNKKFEEITGFSEKEIINKPLMKALKSTFTKKSRNKEMFIESLKKGEIDFDTFVISKRGELRNINVKAKVLKIKGTSFVQAIIRDITERKKDEEKMLYFQKAVESSLDAIGMSTPEGKHYYQNEAFNKLFGLNVKGVEGKEGPPSTVYADKKVGRKIFKTIMSGRPWTGEVEMLSKSRGKILIFLRAYSIKDEQGKIIGLIGVHTDITERKEEGNIKKRKKKYKTIIENLKKKLKEKK